MGETVPDVYTPWLKDGVPEETSAEFQSLLTLTSRTSFEPKGFSWKDAPNPETWCAFGDRGTTALVGAYGDLIQFGAYTGRGQSGMFTADRKGSEEPYWVTDRTNQLQHWAEGGDDFEKHYGLQVYEMSSDSADGPRRILPPNELPELQWVNYRWPRFKTTGNMEDNKPKLETKTQWLAHDGLILQQTRLRYSGPDSIDLRFRLPSGEDAMEIRDLDHVEPDYPINVRYKQMFGPHQYSWVFVHELDHQETTTNGELSRDGLKDSVAVIAAVMQDGRVVRWSAPPDMLPASSQASSKTAEIPGQSWDVSLEADSSTEIVIAYKMVYVPKCQFHIWESFTISAETMDVSTILSEEDPCPDSLRLSVAKGEYRGGKEPRSLPKTPQGASEHIEFVVRRQLEHILSNCAIPLDPHTVGNVRLEETSSESHEAQPPEDHIVPVALTCGDISFHRVSGSASFFAFTFLVEIQSRLQQSTLSEGPYVQRLSQRIRAACQGHIHWLRTVADLGPDKGFLANYWVSGKPIDGSNSQTWLAKESLLDTAFQIIKVDEYAALDQKFGATGRNSIKDATAKWVVEVKEKEHRKSFAWPHTFESIATFRLDDHVWIWRALKATGHQEIASYLKSNEASKKPANIFSHRDAQREILRHFTTPYDDIHEKRILAVTRSCRETRFLFHARDTVLFRAIDWGFPLDEPPNRQLWTNTIESQSLHDENHEDQWDNALRYTLAVVMACREYSLNKRLPQDLLKCSLTTLLESSSPNGLFAGQLDATTKKPICFFREADRDFHSHCTFEIPYILLVNSSRITEVRSEDTQNRQNPESVVNHTPVRGNMEIPESDIIQRIADLMSPSYKGAAGMPGTLLRSFRKPVVLKKRQPFYHLMESTNIIEIGEEWLYNYPAFLNDKPISSDSAANSLMMAYLLEGMDLREPLEKALSSHSSIMLDITRNDEGIRRELCDSLVYFQPDNRLLVRIVLAMAKDPVSIDKTIRPRSEAAKGSVQAVLREIEKLNDLKPEHVDALHATHATAAASPPPVLRTQPSSKSERPWYSIRTLATSSPHSFPGSPAEVPPAPEDPGVPVLEDLLAYSGVKTRIKTILGLYIDVFVLVGSKFPDLAKRIATILSEDDAMLARIVLGNPVLYEALRERISEQVVNGSRIRQEIKRYMDLFFFLHIGKTFEGEAAAPNGLKQFDGRPPSKEKFAKSFTVPDEVSLDGHCGAFVVDTTKKLSQGRVQKAQGPESGDFSGRRIPNYTLWDDVLKQPRTSKTAKKRFLWLPDANMATGLACFLGSPQVERDPMILFFDRHSNYELFFFDDTTPHLNTWETELHISFYQVLETGKSQPTGIPKPFGEPFPSKSPCDLTKASMGFRFFGDFFDRYWTCHFIEYVPLDGPDKAWDLPFDSSSSRSSKNREWKQRKVLELYLFERIVAKVVNSTREIYEKVRTELGVKGEVFSMVALDSGDYFSSSEHWQKCQETLQVVEDRLEHIVTEIAKWDSRERDRGSERPRWTRRDERKYSGEIKKRLGSSNSKVRDLRRLKADITVLKDLLISRQDQIRNDLSLRSDENIRFFTYVTVIFLPLGFAASIFSMSEVPDGQLIGSMAIVAAVALVLTGLALTTNGISRKLPSLSETAVKRSYLATGSGKREKDQTATPDGSGSHAAADVEIGKQGTTWYIRFWLMYVLVEKPTRRVALAYNAMKQNKWTLMTGFTIVPAIALLPYCLFVWLARVIGYNAMDLTRRLWEDLKSRLPDTQDADDNLFRGPLASILNPDSDSMRPFKAKEAQKKDEKRSPTRVPPEQPKLNEIEGEEAPTEA